MRKTMWMWVLLPFAAMAGDDGGQRRWLAGDHHVHSEWSVDWDDSTSPPTPIRGGDSPYSRTDNARAAQRHGLVWMVHTDHGGPNHSEVTRDHAWPALLEARAAVPGVIQFHGMEFDVPDGEHASLIMAPDPSEAARLPDLERRFSRREVLDPSTRDHGGLMIQALEHMQALPQPPLMFVNHPARTAASPDAWGKVTPQELRDWQDAAPDVLVGMEGAPGHQADGTFRGLYRNTAAPTWGGFDRMTAQVGGVWDAMLAEGRRFWITANSDSHRHLDIGGADFFPGEYSKTYVWAREDAADIFDGLRQGRMFVVTGDLIAGLGFELRAGDAHAASGGSLRVAPGTQVDVRVDVALPQGANFNGDRPELQRIDVIVGQAGGSGVEMQVHRFDAARWQRDGDRVSLALQVAAPERLAFVRVRGTSTDEDEPQRDHAGDDPWQDLWFYSNPIFIEAAR